MTARSRRRRLLAVVTTALVALALGAPQALAAPGGRPAPEPTDWLGTGVLNIAHAGGELEAPPNTMYAFRRAVALGADAIELDVHLSANGTLVAIHDAAVDRTTDGSGLVEGMPVGHLRQLDAAHWFVPDRGVVHGLETDAYPLRGVRTHDAPAPDGYRAQDFAVPTVKEILREFPDVPIVMEIKGTSDADTESFLRTARLLGDLLATVDRTDIIVASFDDAAVAAFHELAPHIGTAPGLATAAGYVLGGAPLPEGTVALQLPVTFNGIPVITEQLVARAHADGYAVHVWFSGTAPEDAATYRGLVELGVDGLMVARPTLLEDVLAAG